MFLTTFVKYYLPISDVHSLILCYSWELEFNQRKRGQWKNSGEVFSSDSFSTCEFFSMFCYFSELLFGFSFRLNEITNNYRGFILYCTQIWTYYIQIFINNHKKKLNFSCILPFFYEINFTNIRITVRANSERKKNWNTSSSSGKA